jgi:hypothetical protein
MRGAAIRSLLPLALVPLALGGCAAEQDPGVAPPPEPAGVDIAGFASRQVFEPQLVAEADGTLLMVWRQRAEEGFDLFAARRTRQGSFSEATRINDEPGTVYTYPHDEMRPAIAVAADGQLAAVWADDRAQIRAAFGDRHGASWFPSFRLDQASSPAYRSFTAAGFDADGRLHAVWIDSRLAPQAGAEEPADLFYARVSKAASEWGQVTEINLTADQEASICGCCRPDLETDPDGAVRAVFRNTGEGYRDIFTISGNAEDGFEPPERVGPAAWRLEGCPMSGPLGLSPSGIDRGVLWRDASGGEWELKEGRSGSEEVELVFPEGVGDWKMALSPRSVAASPEVLLLPGRPTSRLITKREGTWELVRDDLPAWATSAAAVEAGLLVVGAVDGRLEAQVLAE